MDPSTALAQIYDSLDVHPPRWYLDSSDCDASVTSQGHLAEGGVSGGSCETITFVASHGTEALLIYPIEPVRPLDALTANVSVIDFKFNASRETSVEEVNGMQKHADDLAAAFELGDPNVDLVQVMVAKQKASLAFDAVAEVRNHLVRAYHDVMNMAI